MARPQHLYTRAPLRTAVLAAITLAGVLSGSPRAHAATTAPAPACTSAPHLSSTYIPPYMATAWDQPRWSSEVSSLSGDCITDIILQYGADAGQKVAYYPTAMSGWSQASADDVIGSALAAADQAGARVFVGLSYNPQWWTAHADPDFLAGQAQLDETMAAELWSKYGSHPSFAGWYLPMEIDSVNFQAQTAWANMVTYYGAVITRLRSLSAGLPIMVAPFYSAAAAGAGGQTSSQWEAMWTYILSRVAIDIVNVQDGTGDPGSLDGSLGTPQVTTSQISQWFAATRAAVTAASSATSLWDDVDLYSALDGRTLPIAQMVANVDAAAPYASAFSSFSYPSQLDPAYVGTAAYDHAYRYYALTGQIASETVGATPSVSATAVDNHTVTLTWAPATSADGVTGYYVTRDGRLIAVLRSGATTVFTDTDAPRGARPTYGVQAFDAVGTVSPGTTRAVSVPAEPSYADMAAGLSYRSSQPASSSYPDRYYDLTDGRIATASYSDPNWQGRLTGSPYSFTLDLGRSQTVNQLSVRALQQPQAGIYLPDSVAYAVSADGTAWSGFGVAVTRPAEPSGTEVARYTVTRPAGQSFRYLRVTVVPCSWTTVWTFVDGLSVDQWRSAAPHAAVPVSAQTAAVPPAGYRLTTATGAVSAFGHEVSYGRLSVAPSHPVVNLASTADDRGYWLVASDGGIFAFGDARFYGSTGAIRLNRPIVGMAATPTGRGYWLVASDGGIFAFGDARFYGSTGAIRLNRPIVGMAATPTGRGYWLVASDGGIFAFGDARFYGSTGGIALARPITGMAPTASGKGYWMVAADGGLFTFGDARFYGSVNRPLAHPVVGLTPSSDGRGYWMVAADGGLFTFGDARFFGSSPGAIAIAR